MGRVRVQLCSVRGGVDNVSHALCSLLTVTAKTNSTWGRGWDH